MTAITFHLQSRVLWLIGARIEIQYIDRGHEVIARRPENLDRQPQVVCEVRQIAGSRY